MQELVELGPYSILRSGVREILAPFANLKAIDYSYIVTKKATGNTATLETVALLYSRGHPVDLDPVNITSNPSSGRGRMPADLPSYRFNHETASANVRFIVLQVLS
jgi:hypothetical protein